MVTKTPTTQPKSKRVLCLEKDEPLTQEEREAIQKLSNILEMPVFDRTQTHLVCAPGGQQS